MNSLDDNVEGANKEYLLAKKYYHRNERALMHQNTLEKLFQLNVEN